MTYIAIAFWPGKMKLLAYLGNDDVYCARAAFRHYCNQNLFHCLTRFVRSVTIMVLDTSSMSDSYGTLPDTPDPYDTSSQTSANTDFSYIDRSQLPHPLPIVGPLFGYTNTYIADLAAARLRYHTEAVGGVFHQRRWKPSFSMHTKVLR